MRIHSIRLRCFRNFKRFQLEFHPKRHLLVGPNGRGKTNLLEAVLLTSQGGSFRTHDYRNLIERGEETAEVLASFDLGLGGQEVRIELSSAGKTVWKDEKKTGMAGLKRLFAVIFSPEEIVVIRGYPQGRRERIDNLFKKLSSNYSIILKEYKKIVLQRNRLLKTKDLSTAHLKLQLAIWDQQLVTTGNRLMEERVWWAEKLSSLIEQLYREISGQRSGASLLYVPCVTKETFETKLKIAFELERIRGLSLVGPHRDDFRPVVSGAELRAFGSQGEGRSFTLALKLAEMTLFQEVWHETPILLLDDVASELDGMRSKSFFDFLSHHTGQVLVTATSANLVPLSKTSEHQTTEIPLNP